MGENRNFAKIQRSDWSRIGFIGKGGDTSGLELGHMDSFPKLGTRNAKLGFAILILAILEYSQARSKQHLLRRRGPRYKGTHFKLMWTLVVIEGHGFLNICLQHSVPVEGSLLRRLPDAVGQE